MKVSLPARVTLRTLRSMRKRLLPGFDRSFGVPIEPDINWQPATDRIRDLLDGPEPAMIARFGMMEFNYLVRYYYGTAVQASFGRKALDYINGKLPEFWFNRQVVDELVFNAGFFPHDLRRMEEFGRLYIVDTVEADVLGTFMRPVERPFLDSVGATACVVEMGDIEPFRAGAPWTTALEGKTVLVIHPFVDTIRAQYEKRELLYEDPRFLPEFRLETIRAVQSIAGNPVEFPDWFAALDSMREQIDRIEFDIAIIGAGAYGFPLAAHVKRRGRRAIQLGGTTQILFGIRGNRWDHGPLSRLYNDHWCRPAAHEVPEDHGRVEGGCYW